MLNMLVVEDNVIQSQHIINYISKKRENIRLCGIAYNGADAFNMLKTLEIDLILLDINLPKISGIELLNQISKLNLERYKNSIIVITGENIDLSQFFNNPYIFSIFSKPLDEKKLIQNIDEIINFKDIENIKNKIKSELQYINYDFKYNGTKYLLESIFQIYIMDNLDSENLSKNIYPIIAKKYKKTVNNIHSNIKQATKCMYRDCDSNILKDYFHFYDDVKPTEKQVIYTIISKI